MRLIAALFALSLCLLGSAEAQTSKPASKPAKKAAKPPKPKLGRLLFSIGNQGKEQVLLHTFATGQTRRFLVDDAVVGRRAVAVSPQGKTVALVERVRPAPNAPPLQELGFRRVAAPKQVLLSLSSAFRWPVFVDETTVLVAELVRDPQASDRYRVLKIDLKTGTRKVVIAQAEHGWDHTPLHLSPDRRWLMFRVKGPRSFRLLDLKTKRVTPILGVTYFDWSPDGKRCMGYDVKKKLLYLYRLKPKGGGIERVAPVFKKVAVGAWLAPGVRMISARAPAGRSGFNLLYQDVAKKQTVKVSDRIPLGLTLRECFARLRATRSFVWVDSSQQTVRLMKGLVVGGKLTKQEIRSGGRMVSPLSIP